MIINRIYETQSSVAVACFLSGRAKDLSAPLYWFPSFTASYVFVLFRVLLVFLPFTSDDNDPILVYVQSISLATSWHTVKPKMSNEIFQVTKCPWCRSQ